MTMPNADYVAVSLLVRAGHTTAEVGIEATARGARNVRLLERLGLVTCEIPSDEFQRFAAIRYVDLVERLGGVSTADVSPTDGSGVSCGLHANQQGNRPGPVRVACGAGRGDADDGTAAHVHTGERRKNMTVSGDGIPTQEVVLAWARSRWPDRCSPVLRALKLAEEAGEVIGAVVRLDEGRGTQGNCAVELAQLVLCGLALAESLGVELDAAIRTEWRAVQTREWVGALPPAAGVRVAWPVDGLERCDAELMAADADALAPWGDQ